jgi:hypothetical protein
MGIKYTEISAGGRQGGAGARTGAGAGRGQLAPGAYYDAGTGITHNSFTEAEAFGPYQPAVTLDSVKQRAATLNAHGRIAQKFGMKTLVHNHTGEFEKLADSPRTTYEVLLEETDPACRIRTCGRSSRSKGTLSVGGIESASAPRGATGGLRRNGGVIFGPPQRRQELTP